MARAFAVGLALAIALGAALAAAPRVLLAQARSGPPIDLPNPYRAGEKWGQLPPPRQWGATDAVAVDRQGRNIWVFERCGGSNCAESSLDPILEFDPAGKLLAHFGAGMFVFPHDIFIDGNGNVWVADADGKNGKGQQVVEFGPDGKVLLTLGRAGVAGDGPDTFNRPSAVVVAGNGDIFVADGHGGDSNARIVKFAKDGTFLKAWGRKGSGRGEFDTPHAIALDRSGRLFVGDRSNGRIQIFDQDGNFLQEWTQFGRPSGIAIDQDDLIYVADSETSDPEGCSTNPGCRRGIRIGSAKDGAVKYFIPDPSPGGRSSGAEGVAVDAEGVIYGAEVQSKDVKRYVKK